MEINQIVVEVMFNVIIIGIIIVISTSNTRNKVATKKNWIENGIRGDLLGSNPHSNGDIFSRSIFLFFLVMMHSAIIIIEITSAVVIIVVIMRIILSF